MKEKNGEETKKLFPLSDAERIDRFLTFVMNEAGVTVDGLNIGQTMQYYIDGEGNLVTASPDEVAGTTDSSASGTDASDGSTGDGSGAAYTATGEYCCDFTYTMEGTYQNMKQMLTLSIGCRFWALLRILSTVWKSRQHRNRLRQTVMRQMRINFRIGIILP